jgi:lipopolysaccharide export system protein LptA
MRNFFSYLYFSFLLLFVSVQLFSQDDKKKYIEVRGQKKIIYDKKLGANRLLGGVTCTHQNVIMTCDSAWLYDNNTIDAFGNVQVRQGDSIYIASDKLHYDGSLRQAALEGNVLCREKDMTLTTTALNYDMKTSTASYFSGASIQNKKNTLTSLKGSYHSPSKTLSFRTNVELKNPQYVMNCDTLQYNTTSKVAYFIGPTTIVSDSNTIYTERGFYNTATEISRLDKNPFIKTNNQQLSGDSIFYFRNRHYGLIKGHVTIRDSAGEGSLSGSKAEYWEKGELSIISGNPEYRHFLKNDTFLIAADTFYAWSDPKSTEKIIRAWNHCRFKKKDLQGICDSITYTTIDSVMLLHHQPVIWEKEMQLTAEQIKIVTGKKQLKKFELTNKAFIITKKDSVNFDQLSGKLIEGFFEKDSLRSVYVRGNVQALYFVEQKKKIIAMNKTECAEIRLINGKDGVKEITFLNKPHAETLPLKDVQNESKYLKGFLWRADEKPYPQKNLK